MSDEGPLAAQHLPRVLRQSYGGIGPPPGLGLLQWLMPKG